MRPTQYIKSILISLFAVLFLIGFTAGSAVGAYSCTNGVQDPPFLSAGVKPNLMLLIDNSASMYDMAYTGEQSNCYDGTDMTSGAESYDPVKVYGGYFKTDTWYSYDTAGAVFEASGPSECRDPINGAAYSYMGELCVTVAGETVTFNARGNVMNWATASKFDIQKQVLTGGKYDDGLLTTTSEGRGCSGNRFIKQIGVFDSGGALNFLNLGIHPVTPPDPMSADPNTGDPTTAIDIFQITPAGFNNTACNKAVELMADESTPLGTLKGLIDECMEYAPNQSYTSAENPAFNQAVQSCWYWDKHGFPEMTGDEKAQHAVSIRNQCEELYESQDPALITPESPGYVCQGIFDKVDDGLDEGTGYVGRCWVPEIILNPDTCFALTCELDKGGLYVYANSIQDPFLHLVPGQRCQDGKVQYCSGNYNDKQDSCNKAWLTQTECTGTASILPGHWVTTDTDTCVTNALYDFCGRLELPQVVDPSDQTADTGEVYNLPAMLTDTGATGQLGDPLLTMIGVIHDSAYAVERPTGILHDVANNIRLGAMKLNYDGAQAECALRDADAAADPKLATILYKCDGTVDGSSVVTDIDDAAANPGHIDLLVEEINKIRANSWTPLAEAVFNAIGYYTQRDDMRLNPADFTIGAPAPCTDWCQNNNILVITEGASTADLHTTVTTFAAVDGQNDGDGDVADKCNDLYGSSFLDDITYYGFQGHDIHQEGDDWTTDEHFQNIRSYFVVAGTPRTQGTGECSPAQMMADAAQNGGSSAPFYADDPQELKDKLKEVLDLIGARAAAGSAASVISATRGGEGAIYQAIFWPTIDGPMVDGERKHEVTWAGEVHALLIDNYGKMYEDTDGSSSVSAGDEQVVLYYDTDLKKSMACDQDLEADGTCGGTSKSIQNVNYHWSAAEWLADIPDTAIETNRLSIDSPVKKRYIYTWNDLDNDGVVDSTELLPFEPRNDWSTLSVSNRAPVPFDFGVTTNDEVNTIIKWVRGLDTPGLRPREVPRPGNFDIAGSPATITWRLGDVVHSTPTAVSRPAEGYHMLYQDASYAEYFDEHQNRRHVVYFGGNDGMVHALNAGFYDVENHKFWRGYDPATRTFSDTGPELGAELWAYVPYNLLPHLKCLTDPEYQHKYFVDLKPRVFDVQIFDSSADTLGHVKGWGTIMVVGMRFGGARTYAQDIVDAVKPGVYTDKRVFTSAYMVFDISDPLQPRLLGETTYDPVSSPPSVDLAYTSAVPAAVPIKAQADGSDWYLILGSGPTDVTGVSSQKPRIGMFPLSLFDTPSTNAFRIPNDSASITHATAGSYILGASANGFVADTVTVDYDLVELFKSDVVYFGTVEGDWGNWGGHLYRWVTDEKDPQSWLAPKPMIDAQRPVSAAPTIGYDGFYYWVYFGTGRFYDVNDKSEYDQEYFFGLKEPVDATTGEFTWATIANTQTASKPASGNDAGTRTLLPVGGIQVEKANSANQATLNCETDEPQCALPVGVNTFADLEDYIVGTCNADDGCTGTDGWAMELEELGERNLGQGALLGGLMTFTTYKPFADICKPEGQAYLYGVYYQTGTAYFDPVFTTQSNGGTRPGDAGTNVVTSRLSIGRGLAMTPNLHVGRQEGSTAFVQTSTGTIVEIPQPNLPEKNTKSGNLSWRGTCD